MEKHIQKPTNEVKSTIFKTFAQRYPVQVDNSIRNVLNKISMPDIGYLHESQARKPPVAPKIIQVIAIALGCLLELDEKTQASGVQNIGKFNWKSSQNLAPCLLLSTETESAMQFGKGMPSTMSLHSKSCNLFVRQNRSLV